MALPDVTRVFILLACALATCWSGVTIAAEDLESARLELRTRQFAMATARLETLAKAGNADAQYLLGLTKINGLVGPVDLPAALPLLRDAARQSHAEAAFALAGQLASAGGDARVEAQSWLDRAAELGYQPAIAQKKTGGLPLASSRATMGLDTDARLALARWAIREGDLALLAASRPQELAKAALPFARTLLHVAAEQGVDATVHQLLADKFAPDARDEFGISPLMLAASRREMSAMMQLIGAGATVDAVDKVGRTALFRAAASNNAEVVRALVKAGANANWADLQGWTALDVAMQTDKPEAAMALRELGAKANLANLIAPRSTGGLDTSRPGLLFKNWPPLFIAVSRDDAAQVRKLLAESANLHAATPQGDTVLHVAIEARATESLKLLLTAGADPGRRNKTDETALQLAVRRGDLAALQALAGANKLAFADQSSTLLLQAVRQGSLETVRGLLALGVSAEGRDQALGRAVLQAVLARHEEILKLLLASGAAANSADKQGRNPLWHASSSGQLRAVQMLLAARAAVNQGDNGGVTPLAAATGSAAVVAALLDSGADVRRRSQTGETPLFVAASLGHADSARALLRAGAKVDETNKHGETPLMVAVRNGNTEICGLLLQSGANLRLRNQDRATAKDIAVARGHAGILRLIEGA